jgi:hypothetical protein
MLTKGKCDGERPACRTCREREQPCEYASELGVTPVASLKRKYESLQAGSANEHELLGILRTGSEEEAIKVLAYLRSSGDIQATLHQARNIANESGDLAASSIPPRRSVHRVESQSSLQATRGSTNVSSIHPTAAQHDVSDGGIPWALPIEPYVCCHVPLVAS